MARSHRRSANGLDLPEFLKDFADEFGAGALKGSILLLRLQREVDDLMSFALGLSPKYHHFRPSPWSHCVLITEGYDPSNPDPRILDCTIRDTNGKVAWTFSLEELLSKPLDRQGGIYPGSVSDYMDERVTRFGIKFIKDLANDDRGKIVEKAWKLRDKGYYYDIPGLFRELARFLFDITWPPPGDLLHCSGFCQKAYFDALGTDGQFDPRVAPEDATDDEIWYPKPGKRYPENVSLPAAVRQIPLASPSVRKRHGGRRRRVRRRRGVRSKRQ